MSSTVKDDFISYLSCWDQNTLQKQFKEGKYGLGSQFEALVHNGKESHGAGSWGSWSRCTCCKEAEEDACWCSAYLLLFLSAQHCTHLGCVFPPQLTCSGKILKDRLKGLFSSDPKSCQIGHQD